jgi:hypothetical protein
MGDVINLNQHRRARIRREQARIAEENRLRAGRSKVERAREALEAERSERRHELLKLDRKPTAQAGERDEPKR